MDFVDGDGGLVEGVEVDGYGGGLVASRVGT